MDRTTVLLRSLDQGGGGYVLDIHADAINVEEELLFNRRMSTGKSASSITKHGLVICIIIGFLFSRNQCAFCVGEIDLDSGF